MKQIKNEILILLTLLCVLLVMYVAWAHQAIRELEMESISINKTTTVESVFPEIIYNTTYSKQDIETMAKVAYNEARGESNEGQQAVIQVILNRSNQSNKSIIDIITRKNQFSIGTTYTDKEIKNVLYTLYYNYEMPEDITYFATYPFRGEKQVWKQIGNHYFMR